MTETTHPCPPAATEVASGLFVRGFAPPLSLRDFGLIAFDMDSTLINIECVDEIAAAAGRTLAEPLKARRTQPPFDASAMDGYALRAEDTAEAPATPMEAPLAIVSVPPNTVVSPV